MDKGLELIKKYRTIFYVSDAMLRGANQKNPFTFPYKIWPSDYKNPHSLKLLLDKYLYLKFKILI